MKKSLKNDEVEFISRKLLELNKQLIESEKTKTAFLSLVSNELNNPMTTLLGMIPYFKPPAGDSKEKIFALLHEEVLNLEFKIQNLVEVAKIESGVCDITYAEVAFESLVYEVLESFQYLIDMKKISVSKNIIIPPFVVLDPSKVHLILKNLLSNAFTYGTPGSVVSIDALLENDLIKIVVKNRGDAPKVDFKPQVFTRFTHTLEGKHGFGIGLSVAKSLCDTLEGSFDYDTLEDVVSFNVTLPYISTMPDSSACGSNEFLFESFDDAIEM